MIGVLHTARINAIEFIVSSDKLIISLPSLKFTIFINLSQPEKLIAICSRPDVGDATLGTLRYATSRCYYGYFGREGLGWQRCFTRQTQMIKILLYSNGMCSLYVSLQKWLLSRKPEIILLSYEIGLINDNDFLLLYPFYISRTQICLLELDRNACNSNHKTR